MHADSYCLLNFINVAVKPIFNFYCVMLKIDSHNK